MNRVLSAATAALLAVASTAVTVQPLTAMPMAGPAANGSGGGAGIERVRDRWLPRDGGWRSIHRYRPRHSFGYPRYRYYPRYHHHHHNDIGVAVTLGILGFAAGAALSGGHHGLSWHEACARKYRSFNWDTGMYLGYDGRWHRCRLP